VSPPSSADGSGNTGLPYTTPVSQANDVIDTIPPEITGVSIPDTAMAFGDTVVVTITVVDDGGDLYILQSGTVADFDLSGLIRLTNTSYTAQFTITDDTVIVDGANDIPVDITLEDMVGHVSNTYTTPISQASDAINVSPDQPVITNVSIPDTAMVTGDTVTVTLNVVDDGGDFYTLQAGTVAGFTLVDLTKLDNTTYTAQFTISDDSTVVAAGGDIPVTIILVDSNGLASNTYTKAISQDSDSINAGSDTDPPVITHVSIPDTPMFSSDTVTVTITVLDDGGDMYTNLSGEIAGFSLFNLTRVDSTTYTAQFTVKMINGTALFAGSGSKAYRKIIEKKAYKPVIVHEFLDSVSATALLRSLNSNDNNLTPTRVRLYRVKPFTVPDNPE